MELDRLLKMLSEMAWQLPSVAIYAIGLAIAIGARERQPRIAPRLATAFGLLLGSALLSLGVRGWWSFAVGSFHSQDLMRFSSIVLAASFLGLLLQISAWVLLLFALRELLSARTEA